ncbi:hypothetical protein CR513_46740, partial [Mucuna pruriens]
MALHHDDPMVVSMLGLPKSDLEECSGILIGFAGEQIEIRGMFDLKTTFMVKKPSGMENLAQNILTRCPTLQIGGWYVRIQSLELHGCLLKV